MMEAKKIRKNDLVTVTVPCGVRGLTGDEIALWQHSDESKGMTSDGETKLPPNFKTVEIVPDREYRVLRARCRPRFGWMNPRPGMVMVRDTSTLEEFYVDHRDVVQIQT